MPLPNDTKTRFCNAMNALTRHTYECTACTLYIERGDGDLCDKGKDIIAMEMAYAKTHAEFPPNTKLSSSGTADNRQQTERELQEEETRVKELSSKYQGPQRPPAEYL